MDRKYDVQKRRTKLKGFLKKAELGHRDLTVDVNPMDVVDIDLLSPDTTPEQVAEAYGLKTLDGSPNIFFACRKV